MYDDILTVMWKERKGLFRYRGSRVRFLLTLATPVLLAVVMPISWGPEWVHQVPAPFLSILIPTIWVGITIPDSFAGERERHTLETLLASRLPDRAILFGKIAVAVAMAWIGTLIVVLLSLVVVNIAHWQGELLLYTPPVAVASLSLSFLMATLCAGAGVLISMRTATAQEASQILMGIILVPPMLLQVVVLLLGRQFIGSIESIDGEQLLIIVLAVLVLLDAGVMVAAITRFQRARLSLD